MAGNAEQSFVDYLLFLLIEKAVVWEDKLELTLKTSGIKSLMEGLKNE